MPTQIHHRYEWKSFLNCFAKKRCRWCGQDLSDSTTPNLQVTSNYNLRLWSTVTHCQDYSKSCRLEGVEEATPSPHTPWIYSKHFKHTKPLILHKWPQTPGPVGIIAYECEFKANILTLKVPCKICSRWHFKIFIFYFSEKTSLDISC